MPVNSRAKGANFEREIGNLLVKDLNLINPVKRILEQTRTKELPDLRLGRWCIECKRYGDGGEPPKEWWDQVLRSCSQEDSLIPALVYIFNRRPIKVRILASSINSARTIAERGANSEGFKTIVQPAANAGITFKQT